MNCWHRCNPLSQPGGSHPNRSQREIYLNAGSTNPLVQFGGCPSPDRHSERSEESSLQTDRAMAMIKDYIATRLLAQQPVA